MSCPKITVQSNPIYVQAICDEVHVVTATSPGPAYSGPLWGMTDVADSARPTLGNIPWGDGALWQSVALTPALAGADPAGSAATAQAAAQAFAAAADVTLLGTANSTALGYANTAQTNAATRSDNASNLSSGVVSSALLPVVPTNKGGLGVDVSASAGYIKFTAGVPAFSAGIPGADIASGTLPVARLNGGNSTQFVRADGTYSNALTGGLTIAGALAGATTGSFSGAVATGALTVTGAMAASGAVSGTTGTFSGDVIRATPGSESAGLFRTNTTAGADHMVVGITAASGLDITRSGWVLCRGINNSGNPGGVDIRASSAGGQTRIFYGPTNQPAFYVVSNSVTIGNNLGATVCNFETNQISCYKQLVLSSGCKIIYGAAGTTTAANSETTGTSTGPVTNAPSGSTVRTAIAGTTVVTVGNTGLASAGIVSGTNVYVSSGNAFGVNTLSGSDTGSVSLSGCNTIDNSRAGYVTVYGINNANVGNVNIRPANSVSAQLNLIYPTVNQAALRVTNTQILLQATDGTQLASLSSTLTRFLFGGAAKLDITSSAVSIGASTAFVLSSGAPATATSTGTAGQIAWDASGNIYICSATNTWRRVATTTF